jgi:hypothetical protein
MNDQNRSVGLQSTTFDNNNKECLEHPFSSSKIERKKERIDNKIEKGGNRKGNPRK